MKVGFISDIHEDIHSLIQALELLNKEKVHQIVCLGDVVGFSLPYYQSYIESRDAKACIETVKKNCRITTVGNHDLFAIRKTPKYQNNFNYPDNWYALSSAERKKMSLNKLYFYDETELPSNAGNKELEFLNELCEYEKLVTDQLSIFLSHFVYPDLSGSCRAFPKSKKFYRQHTEFMDLNNCQISFHGHGHYEGIAVYTKRKFKILPFGNYVIKTFPVSISVPCIADSHLDNGITIFDTETYELKVIPIRKSLNRKMKYETIR